VFVFHHNRLNHFTVMESEKVFFRAAVGRYRFAGCFATEYPK